MDVNAALQLADNLGVAVVAVILAYAIWKGHLVPGWVHNDCTAENKELRTLLNAHASRTEARVDKLEQERDRRYGTTT